MSFPLRNRLIEWHYFIFVCCITSRYCCHVKSSLYIIYQHYTQDPSQISALEALILTKFIFSWSMITIYCIDDTTKNYIILSSNKLKVNKNIQIAPIVQLYVRVYSKQLNVYLSRTFLYKSSLLLKALDAKHTLAIQARWYVVERVQITD